MKLFLSNAVSPTDVRTWPHVIPKPRKYSKTLIVTMTGFTAFWIGAGNLAQAQPAVAVLSSLLSGFAPLIGLCVLFIVLSLFISLLACTVERTFADEDDGIVPRQRRKSKCYCVAYFLSDLFSHCLSLKEHSPPDFVASRKLLLLK